MNLGEGAKPHGVNIFQKNSEGVTEVTLWLFYTKLVLN